MREVYLAEVEIGEAPEHGFARITIKLIGRGNPLTFEGDLIDSQQDGDKVIRYMSGCKMIEDKSSPSSS